jgi:hypothetical protein
MSDELRRAYEERDQALQRLAEARAELDALRRSLENRGEEEPPLYPDDTAAGLPPPLRYVIADALNGVVKKALGRGR